MRRQRSWVSIGLLSMAIAGLVHAKVGATQATQVGAAEVLQNALAEYRTGDHKNAEALCQKVILGLSTGAPLGEIQLRQLLAAYELRGRARFILGSKDGAREDFRSILVRAPNHVFGSATPEIPGINPNHAALFEATRKETIGYLVLAISPEDADVKINEGVIPVDQRSGGKVIALPAGPVQVVSQKPGHNRLEELVTIEAGNTITFARTLERVSSKLSFVVAPQGAEIYIDEVARGRASAPLPPNYATSAEVIALGARDPLGFLEVDGIKAGRLRLEFRAPCYQSESRSFPMDRNGDFFVAPVRLTKSAAPLSVEGAGGEVFVDGAKLGPVPLTNELCPRPDPYVVEVRSGRGRHIKRVTPVTGQKISFLAEPKPAIAILSLTGLPDSRSDLRLDLETALEPARYVTVFALQKDVVQRELEVEQLEPGWLAFDTTGRGLSTPARTVSVPKRLAAASNLAQRLQVQGIAEIHVPGGAADPRNVLFTYLAAGSSTPETMRINLDDRDSLRNALALLNARAELVRVSSGILVADVQDVAGAVVLRQVWKTTGETTLSKGDVIVAADGGKLQDGSAFDALIARKKAGDKVTLDVRRAAGSAIQVTLEPLNLPQVVGYDDQTLLVNRLIVDFRLAGLDAATPYEETIARLNLGVMLMRGGNWTAARTELEKVTLPDGPGVSRGTVKYLLGLCHDAVGNTADADRAFTEAAASVEARLTSDGPLIKPLADKKLNDPARRRR